MLRYWRQITFGFLKIVAILLVVSWIVVVFVDYFKATKDNDPQFCIKEEVKTYDDGKVYICTGLGYKIYNYNRKSIKAVEFGPFFIKERKN